MPRLLCAGFVLDHRIWRRWSEALTSIVEDGIRAAEVIKGIRALMKKTPPRKDRLEVNGVILEIIELARGEAVKHGVSVLTELEDPSPWWKQTVSNCNKCCST